MHPILAAQLADDYCCTVDQVQSPENVFTVISQRPGQRGFHDPFRAACVDGKLLVAGSPEMAAWCREHYAQKEAAWFMEFSVLRALNEEAKKQNRTHEVILMMDLGDLREGFWNEEDAIDAALEIERELTNLKLLGVGVNLSCYGSVKPNTRNMQALVSLAADIEREIGRRLDYISGGASTSLYMAVNGTMPYRINLLRIGDMALRGETDGFVPGFLHKDVFTIKAEVIECREKPSFPVGELTVNAFGEVGQYEDRGIRRRALVALGRVDYGNCFDLVPRMKGVEILGASSDHTILDVEDAEREIRVGDVLEFGIRAYGPLVYLTNTPSVRMAYRGGE